MDKAAIQEVKGTLSETDQATINASWQETISSVLIGSQAVMLTLPTSFTITGHVQDFKWYNICSSTSLTMALVWYGRYYDPQLLAPNSVYTNNRPHSVKINDYIFWNAPYYGNPNGVGVDEVQLAYTNYISTHSNLSYSVLNTTGVTDETIIFETYKDYIYYNNQPAIVSYFWSENGVPKAHAVCGYGYAGNYYCVRDT